MRSTIFASMLAVVLALGACATPVPEPVTDGGVSGRARGGNAEGQTKNTKIQTQGQQPGGTGTQSMVENSDAATSTQAGDAIQLLLGGGGRPAFDYLNAPTSVETNLVKHLESVTKQIEDTEDPVARAPLVEEAAALRKELVAHMEFKLENAKSIAGSFAALQQVTFIVVQMKVAGQEAEKMTAEAIKAAAENMKVAVQPAANATE